MIEQYYCVSTILYIDLDIKKKRKKKVLDIEIFSFCFVLNSYVQKYKCKIGAPAFSELIYVYCVLCLKRIYSSVIGGMCRIAV